MSVSRERLARNQALFRSVNERIGELADDDGTTEFVCECSNPDCLELIELTDADYEQVRSNSTWFLIKPDHDIPQIEGVISRDEGYVVVEKVIAREALKEADPRADAFQEGSDPQPGLAGA